MLESGLYQLLRDDATIAALISGRIFGSRMPKDPTLPAVVYTVVSTRDVYSLAGASGFRVKRVQLDSYAKKYSEAVTVSDAVRKVLQSFTGNFPDGSQIFGCVVDRDMDFPYEPGPSGYIHRRMFEVEIQYSEQQ